MNLHVCDIPRGINYKAIRSHTIINECTLRKNHTSIPLDTVVSVFVCIHSKGHRVLFRFHTEDIPAIFFCCY